MVCTFKFLFDFKDFFISKSALTLATMKTVSKINSQINKLSMKPPVIFIVMLLTSATIVSAQSKTGRKIIDTHFHALKWNSFGVPPPPNEVTGVTPTAKSDSEEQAAMLAALKKNSIVKAILSGVPH